MRIHHREDDSPSRYGGDGWSTNPGDVVEVDDEVGNHLVETKRYFEAAEEDTQELSGDEGTLTPEDVAGENWQTAVSLVEDGEVDDSLDELEEIDERDSVQEAVDERRSTIED